MNRRTLTFIGLALAGCVFGTLGLANAGNISGMVIDASTGLPITVCSGFQCWVDVWNENHNWVTNGAVGPTGSFTTNGSLPTGNYFARINNEHGFFGEVYDDFPYNYAVPQATPISVVEGNTTSGIDFVLEPGGGTISGNITDAETSAAVHGDWMFLYDSNGLWSPGGIVKYAGSSGTYITSTGLEAGTYYMATDADQHVNELYDDIRCQDVPCNPLDGTPITVVLGEDTGNIDFALMPAAVFADGFEDGDTSAWSNTVQ